MKNIVILAFILMIFTGAAIASNINNNDGYSPKSVLPSGKEKFEEQKRLREKEFEQKLGLTDNQITKAKELREQGFIKIKPVMDELHLKRIEALKIKNSDLSNEVKEEKLLILDKEVQELHKKASEIRKQNMKDFESILDKNQRNVLNNMKKEGRTNFQKDHRMPPPHINGESKFPMLKNNI